MNKDVSCKHTKTFGVDSTALERVDGPVVVLQSVHQLKNCADTTDGGVDGGGADELRWKVSVERQLDLNKHSSGIQMSNLLGYKSSVCFWCSTNNRLFYFERTATGEWEETSLQQKHQCFLFHVILMFLCLKLSRI